MAPKSCCSRSGPPLEPYRARTLFLETPPELPKACFGRPGGARNPPKRARSLQGPDQIHKVSMLKTLEICVFGPQGSQKNTLGPFFDAPNASPGPSLAPPENPLGPNLRKNSFFSKITETTINIMSGAFRGKRQQLQNYEIRVLPPPLEPSRA